MKKDKILVIGACGQIGTELTIALRWQYGDENVIAADRHLSDPGIGYYIQLDVLNQPKLEKVVKTLGITQVYLLAAMLSANGEKDAAYAWKLNMQSLLSVLDVAKDHKLDKVFWPSSIAVFGPGAPKHLTPQYAQAEPQTVYGISKKAGEHWCNYYFEKYDVDVRSLRYPGLISFTAPPGGGTTDYAIQIFHQALEKKNYTCFLKENTCLPMLYMPDAIRATLQLMNAPKEKILIRTAYNLAGMNFSPCDLTASIQKYIPEFQTEYHPDYRQAIADGWPASINDEEARSDWGWKPEYDLEKMTREMLQQLARQKGISLPGLEVIPAPIAASPDIPHDNYVFTRIDQ